jgi:hypothetical protein
MLFGTGVLHLTLSGDMSPPDVAMFAQLGGMRSVWLCSDNQLPVGVYITLGLACLLFIPSAPFAPLLPRHCVRVCCASVTLICT